MKPFLPLLFLFLVLPGVPAQENRFVAENDVIWPSLGTNENDSMPIGNGDLAANVWTEQNGDIVLLVAKSDAWSENGQLLKLGRIRIRMTPNPFTDAGDFKQTLELRSGTVQIQAAGNIAKVWVDANRPVTHVEIEATKPIQLEVRSELWRTIHYHLNQHAVQQAGFFEWGNNPEGLDFDSDIVLAARDNRVSWCHFNVRSIYPMVFAKEHLESLVPEFPDPLLHRCFGITMKGPDLISSDDHTLKSARAAKVFRLDLCALTQQVSSPEEWRSALDRKIESVGATSLRVARKAHEKWWADFWNRSWIQVEGSRDAKEISQSYAMQRYMTACAGRGAQPIKFNGSLFTVGHDLPEGVSSSESNHDPDFRAWGASFWNQNTRFVYWPMIATGDQDLLAPWYKMYVQALPLAKARTKLYFHHDGASFIETIYFWGLPNVNDFGWNNPGPELSSQWMRYHIQGELEVLAQMLDTFDYTQDLSFAQNSLLPFGDAIVTYYDQHWKRGADGKILISPSQSIETYQGDAVNPTPDIAGLKCVLPRLLALPKGLITEARRTLWTGVLNELPDLSLGTTANGKLPKKGHGDETGTKIILPAEKYGEPKNSENPELYTVFPYRLYGTGKPDLELARNTFAARLYPFAKCWGQDGVESALLGLTDEAKNVVTKEFTSYGNQRFKWFWSKNSDWIPDMDNGGAGMETLQLMLMQCDGKTIRLLPAWPKDWTANFKLHAPSQTTVEGQVNHGKITRLKVTPAERAKDVITAE